MKVVQLNIAADPERRDPEALLAAWPTLPAVAAAAARAGAEVTVLQASHADVEHRQAGVAYRFVRASLAAAVRRERPDVVHLNGLDFPVRTRAVCRLGAPVLVQDHASRPTGGFAPLRRWGLAKIAGAAFTSAAQAEPFRSSGQLPPSARIFAIPESSSRFTTGSRAEARRATGVHGDPALLWVGRLDRNKDPLTVLHAVRQALPALPGLHLWCAFTATDLLPEIESLLRKDERLAAHVHLLGPVPHDRVEQLCRAADVFVSSSRSESCGFALIEALACGLPPIVSDIPAFAALVDGAGPLLPCGDSGAFARAIVRQSFLPRAEQRARTRAHFEANLSFDVVGRKLVAAYAELAAGAGR